MPYFFNTETQQSTWEPPSGMTREEVEQLPGFHFLKGGAQPVDKSGQVRASHLLVKHSGSRRPASWKDVRLPTISMCIELQLFHQAKHHAFQGRGHRHPQRLPSRDRRIQGEIRATRAAAL